MGESGPVTAVVVALIGLVGAAISNLDRIYPIARQILGLRSKESSALMGEWTGLFREYRAESGIEEVSEESVDLKVIDQKVIGTLSAMRAHRRVRTVEGEYRHDFLVLTYFAADPGRVGAAAMVLRGKAEMGRLNGYWLGYDPEKERLVAGPYVLTRERHIDRAKGDHRKWLDQPCYPLS